MAFVVKDLAEYFKGGDFELAQMIMKLAKKIKSEDRSFTKNPVKDADNDAKSTLRIHSDSITHSIMKI